MARLRVPTTVCVLASVLLVAAVTSPAGAASSLSSFWQHELPQAAMPASLETMASPLSAQSTELYLNALLSGTLETSTNSDFCSSAGIYCSQKDVTVVGANSRTCIGPFLYQYGLLCGQSEASMAVALKSADGMFFLQSSLLAGKTISLPNTANDLHGLRFLPSSLAEAMPQLKDQNMPQLMKFYGVKVGSDMEFNMEVSLAHCGYKSDHELKTCHVSGESMVGFAADTVGHDAVVYAPLAVAAQDASIQGISMVGAEGSKVISCHNMQFPSLMFSCHMTQTAKYMDVTVKLANGNLVQMQAVCHMDTSYWNPSHVAFKVLNVKPGEGPVCHWFPQNSFIFVGGSK